MLAIHYLYLLLYIFQTTLLLSQHEYDTVAYILHSRNDVVKVTFLVLQVAACYIKIRLYYNVFFVRGRVIDI